MQEYVCLRRTATSVHASVRLSVNCKRYPLNELNSMSFFLVLNYKRRVGTEDVCGIRESENCPRQIASGSEVQRSRLQDTYLTVKQLECQLLGTFPDFPYPPPPSNPTPLYQCGAVITFSLSLSVCQSVCMPVSV